LWDSELGSVFQQWGQELIKELGKTSWSPRKERTWKMFLEKSDLESEAQRRFGDPEIVKTALELGRAIGKGIEREDLQAEQYIKGIREVCLASAPHVLHVESLREITEVHGDRPLVALIKIFDAARIGERASLGQIALERIEAIKKLESMLPAEADAKELDLQKLLEASPWLINPQWTLLSANVTFENVRKAFEIWYKDHKGVPVKTTALGSAVRPDFVLLHVGRNIEICEIKKPHHALEDDEFERILNYFGSLEEFLSQNPSFKALFPNPHVTLVCDQLKLGALHKEAYQRREERGDLVKKTWLELLGDTQKVHEAFLKWYKGGGLTPKK
jgi:hypothetical protein